MLESLNEVGRRIVHTTDRTTHWQFTQEQVEIVRRELDLVLISPQFTGSKRSHDFLVFIVSRTLEGNTTSLAERFIGADLFGRPVDYDTKTDSIVRVCANDVRRRLAEYHSHQTSNRPVTITLTSGSYIPDFQWAAPEDLHDVIDPAAEKPSAEPQKDVALVLTTLATGHEEPARVLAAPSPQKVPRRTNRVATISALTLIVVLSLACSFFWYQLRAARQTLYPWKSSPALAEFWETLLSGNQPTDLVLSDSSYSLIQALTNRPIGLDAYLSRSYVSQLQAQSPDMTAALLRISKWGLGSSSEFDVVQDFLSLDPTRQKIHLYASRKYMPDLMMHDNVILVGSPFGNPWAQLFEGRMNFSFEQDNPNEILNRNPSPSESHAYDFTQDGSVGYCILAYLPNPEHTGSTLLIQGTSGESTQAAGDFLVSELEMAGLEELFRTKRFPYFELLLKTTLIKGTPLSSSIIAYRIYPDLH